MFHKHVAAALAFPATVVVGLFLPADTAMGQVVRSGAGATAADITAVRDQFRVDLGGGNVAGANGAFGVQRREINWDGTPAGFSAPNNLPANFFNVNSPRGAVLSTPGTGFQVSGATTDAGAGQPAAANFGNINAPYTSTFSTFSAQRLFTALGSNITDVTFFVPGTTTPATVSGFGAVFTDVDLPNNTSIQYFDVNNVSLGTFFVPADAVVDAGQSFLGVSFASSLVGRVRITSGNAALGAGVIDNNGNPNDLVAMDDFIYSEPTGVPEPAVGGLLAAGSALLLRRRGRRQ